MGPLNPGKIPRGKVVGLDTVSIIYFLRTPDAIHTATALAGQADYFVTNDRRMFRLEKERIINILLFS
jgi:predicted nucleic acid-binding protein